DRYGRRRVFVTGVIWFAVASALCAVAPDIQTLIVARALEGVGGALLTPRPLANIPGPVVPGGPPQARGAPAGLGGGAWRDRPVPGRLAGQRGGLALGVPDQLAAGGDRGRGGGPACTRDQGRDRAGPLRRARGGARGARADRDHLRADRSAAAGHPEGGG